MASLTPLSKGIIALAVVGAVVSVVWNFGLKDWMRSGGPMPAPPAVSTPRATQIAPAPAPAPAAAPSPPNAVSPGASVAEDAETGRKQLDSGKFDLARVHLERAVKGGDGAAACHLGDMTLKGQGGIQADQEKAAKLFLLAQSRGVICFTPGK